MRREVGTRAKVILNENGVPVELKYSSETPSPDEIFQDMQKLEDHVKEKRRATAPETQAQAYLICLNRLLLKCANEQQSPKRFSKDRVEAEKLLRQYNAKYEDFLQIVSGEAAKAAVGNCAFWAHYLNYLLSNAGISSHVSNIVGTAGTGHAIVIYRVNPTMPWMVLTCGYNPANRRLVSGLTLGQYLLDYISAKPSDTSIFLFSRSFGETVNNLSFRKDTPHTFTPEVINMYIDHLLAPLGTETTLTEYLASCKAQQN